MKRIREIKPSALTMLWMVVVFIGAGWGGYALADLQDFNGFKGRSYHAKYYEKGRCETCHAVKEPTGYPADDACLKCHDLDEIVAATARADEEETWQNPHNNLHYGTEVPCVECHGEHSNKEPMCANCHKFEYPNHVY